MLSNSANELKFEHRPANERGKADHGWLKSNHSFSFGQYHDCGPQKFNHSLSNHDLIVMMKPAKYWSCYYSISRLDFYWQPHNVCARFGNPGRNTGT